MIAEAWLHDRFPDGFEEHDLGSAAEFAVYTDDRGEALVRTEFANVRTDPVAGGWEDRWKEFHSPVRAGGIWIGPPWIEPPRAEPAVVVDPGRAFGTGAHPSTRACVELLAQLERGSLLDAGCGSGVIAVAAARLGFSPVHAVDLDGVSVEVAAETARRNGVSVDVFRANVLEDELPVADVVVANIELRVVERLLHRLEARTAVTSGYLESECPVTVEWAQLRRLALEGWAADVWARRH